MKTWASLVGLVLVVSIANSAWAVIDFESAPGGGPPTDDAPIGAPYIDSGVTISFGFDYDTNGVVDAPAVFERAGTFLGEAPNAGFSGSDGVDTADVGFGGQLGNWFLRSPIGGSDFGRFIIKYSAAFPVTAASGEIWDIDGQLPDGPATEQYHVEAFDSLNNSLGVDLSPLGTLTTNLAPLDGQPWKFQFSGLSGSIDHIYVTFVGSKTQGIGLAFNNFYPVNAVPEPTAALLVVIGGAAIALVRRR